MTIAGIGSRTLAWLLDGAIIALALLLIGLIGFRTVEVDSLFTQGLLSVALLLLPFTYLIAFETLNGGRTPGKAAAGITVVQATGSPLGFGGALIRALLLPIDVLLLGAGVVSMFATRRSQRLGDIAARTVVIRDRDRVASVAAAAPDTSPPIDAERPRWDVSAVTEQEIGAIRSFLSRAAGLPHNTRSEYAARLRARLEPRIVSTGETLADEAYLERVVREKSGA
jgi:uncharacterized RDD family membrane protein YckC